MHMVAVARGALFREEAGQKEELEEKEVACDSVLLRER